MLKSIEATLPALGSAFCEAQATIYYDSISKPKASILYFHGGGFVYGTRKDLPLFHLQTLTEHGYAVIAFDYPLAPHASLDEILKNVILAVNSYIDQPDYFIGKRLPYYLWGRSAGAYLVLMAAASGELHAVPAGILSYYGYGLLTDGWLDAPNPYYSQLPPVNPSLVETFKSHPRMSTSVDEGFSLYVYGRQSGTWPALFYTSPLKNLYRDFSLRSCSSLECPVFCAHCINDPDIPFSEFQALSQRLSAECFIAAGAVHDFDRITSSIVTKRLLKATIEFLENHMPDF